MSIKNLSDEALLTQIKFNAAQERRFGLAVIHELREVAARRLDAKLGYDSLKRYCMEELGYSNGSAWRRVDAMNALQAIPELEVRIQAGELTLASVSQVESFCRREEKSTEEKRAIFDRVRGLSKRKCERVLADIAPFPEKPEQVRALNADGTELRITLNAQTVAALDHIKNLISHARPNATYAEAIEYLAKLGMKKLDPTLLPDSDDPERIVWKRDGGRCTYRSPGGVNCHAEVFVQCDHIIPRAKGGAHHPDNMRLRCRSHNLLAAVEEFGEAKMAHYLTARG